MRYKVLSVVAAAAMLASVGVANAKDAVKLQDVQLDKITAGASSTAQTASLVADSTATLNRLVTISAWTVGVLNGVPQAPLPLSALSLPAAPITP